jgi:CubicO group peptidase (beta-lactamase class C family)
MVQPGPLMTQDLTRRRLLGGLAATMGTALLPVLPASAQIRFAAAAAYNAANRGISLVVMRGGRIEFEDYPNGGAADRPHETASGTKSFTGIMAAAAVQDGLLTLDEPAARTLSEWRDDPAKGRITIRHILSLTSGLETRRARGNLLTYEESIAMPIVADPGARFAYGGDPFQLFGAILTRKLGPEDPVAYLQRRVLGPAGVQIGSWRRGRDDMPTLGSGARLTARNWAAYGEFVRGGGRVGGRPIVDPDALAANFAGSAANPAYGLGWWLNRPMPDTQRNAIPQLRHATDVAPDPAIFPDDLVLAAGAGKQRLYISRSEGLVVVRQATGILGALDREGQSGFSDAEFWRLLRG